MPGGRDDLCTCMIYEELACSYEQDQVEDLLWVPGELVT